MSKIKYALVVVLLILLAVCSVSAAEFKDEISVDAARGIVTVTGKPTASRANKAVTVQVEISRNDGAEIAFVNQINADARGSFTLSFSLTSPGNYTLNLAEAGVKGIASTNFFFAQEQSQTIALAQINSATKETIASVMENDDVQAVMNLGDLYYSLTGSGVDMTQLYYSIAEHDAFENAEDFSLWFRKSVFVYAMDTNDADNGANAVSIMENYGAELGVSQWMGYSYYQNFDSAQREAIGKSLSSKNITSFENMENKYDEAVFMQYISNCISPGKINTLFKDIRDSGKDYGLDLTGYFSLSDTSYVDKGIYGGSFAGMTALQNKLNALVAQYAQPGNSSQSGSGGGSSSSGGGASNVIAVAPGYTETVNTPSAAPFVDLGDAEWARESVLYLYDKKVISDDPSLKFRPNDNVTREEFAKMLVVSFGLETEGAQSDFDDVSTSDWCYPYISAGYSEKLLNGDGNGLFGKGQNISRMDAAVMAYRFARHAGMEFQAGGEGFNDMDIFADYAIEPVMALKNKNVINGYDGNSFMPYKTLTRAESAKILHKLLVEVHYEN